MRHYELNRTRVHTEESKLRLAKYLTQSQTFDNFMGKKFGTVKRYGAEGAESMMVFFDEVLMDCVGSGVEEIVVGMAHRGRLNLLTGLMQLSKETFFHKVCMCYVLPCEWVWHGGVSVVYVLYTAL